MVLINKASVTDILPLGVDLVLSWHWHLHNWSAVRVVEDIQWDTFLLLCWLPAVVTVRRCRWFQIMSSEIISSTAAAYWCFMAGSVWPVGCYVMVNKCLSPSVHSLPGRTFLLVNFYLVFLVWPHSQCSLIQTVSSGKHCNILSPSVLVKGTIQKHNVVVIWKNRTELRSVGCWLDHWYRRTRVRVRS